VRERGHLEDAGIDGRILRWVWGGMDWVHLAQDRDKWWALLNMVMNLQVPSNTGNFLTS
jgi:hypothetical protein